MSATDRRRLIVGAMIGTSMDGIDAVLTESSGSGLAARGRVLARASGSLGPARKVLAELARGVPVQPELLKIAAADLGHDCGQVMRRACGQHTADLAIVHGQTVLHDPPETWQVIDAVPTAAVVGCPTAYDLRHSDLDAGGRGAPITPLGDWVLLRSPRPRVIVNLGGFCNITWLPPEDDPDAPRQISGADVCVCNLLLNAVAQQALGAAFDEGGRSAAAGTVIESASAELVTRLQVQMTSGRALGSGDELLAWLDHDALDGAPGANIAATAVTAIGQVIGEAIGQHSCDEVLLAGGGTHHLPLVTAIAAHAPAPVRPTGAYGVDVEAREAACLCALAALERDGIAPTLPQVTGRRADATVCFSWTGACAQIP